MGLQSQPIERPVVLIIDDNPSIRAVVASTLHCGGFQPVEAANGLEAIAWMERVAREQRYPQVILLDLAMPQMDGHAFLEWLQSSWGSRYPIPAIILLTACYLNAQLLPLYVAVKQIVAKPFHVRDLLEIVRAWST